MAFRPLLHVCTVCEGTLEGHAKLGPCDAKYANGRKHQRNYYIVEIEQKGAESNGARLRPAMSLRQSLQVTLRAVLSVMPLAMSWYSGCCSPSDRYASAYNCPAPPFTSCTRTAATEVREGGFQTRKSNWIPAQHTSEQRRSSSLSQVNAYVRVKLRAIPL